jgi:putative sugar O-methyltransferase
MMMNTLSKIKKLIIEKRLYKTIKKKLYPYFKGLLLFIFFRKNNFEIVITADSIVDKNDLPIAERIFDSYKKMKKDQLNVSQKYKPSSLWQNHIDNDFSFLKKSYENEDLEKFLFFLQNFGNWDKYLGIENQTLIKKYNKNIFLKKFLSNEIFNGQMQLWKYFNKETSKIAQLNMPRFGNQNGALIDNNFVVLGSFFNEIYSKIINKYLDKNNHNVIADLGGGYGKLAYYCLKDLKKYTFIDFDIPETLILASYFLTKSFPNKKVFYYGEQKLEDINIKDYDLIFMPSWEIEKIKNDSVEFMINRNSLGEIEPESADNYINQIHRISKYFFSSNHEYFRNKFDNNKSSLLNSEYNKNNKFKELIRYPDIGHLTYENNKIDLESDIFFYIFKKN